MVEHSNGFEPSAVDFEAVSGTFPSPSDAPVAPSKLLFSVAQSLMVPCLDQYVLTKYCYLGLSINYSSQRRWIPNVLCVFLSAYLGSIREFCCYEKVLQNKALTSTLELAVKDANGKTDVTKVT